MADKKKHRYLVAILCMALLCPYIMTVLAEGAGMLFASAAPIPVKGVCTANELNIRSGPGTNYEQVKVNGVGAYLTKNQEVEILSEKNGWYEVRTTFQKKSVTGYSLGTYIKVTATVTPTPTPKPTATPKPTKEPDKSEMIEVTTYKISLPASVTANELNFRTSADTGADIIATLKNGDTVTVLGQKTVDGRKWYKISKTVSGKKKTGYAVSDYIKFTPAKGFYVKTNAKMGLNSSAGSQTMVKTSAGKDVSVAKGTKLYVLNELSKNGEKWFQVEVTVSKVKYKGYVKSLDVTLVGTEEKTYVTPTPTPTPTQAPSVEGDQKFQYAAAITANELNMRKKASTSSDVLVLMKKGQKVNVLDEVRVDGTVWYYISGTVDGKKYNGYAVASYIKLNFDTKVYASAEAALKLREKANSKAVYVTTKSGTVLSIPKGDIVELLAETSVGSSKWFQVKATVDGKEYKGYATSAQLSLAAAKEAKPTPTPSATPKPSDSPTPSATPEPTPSSTPIPTPSPTPTITPIPLPEPIGKGTIIEGVEALALKMEPKYGSKLVLNENGYSVVVTNKGEFDILEYVPDQERVWCYVSFVENGVQYVGYINAEYVKQLESGDISSENPTPTPTQIPLDTTDFELMLSSQNFPESYKEGLRMLHEQHPTWQFVAHHTGLDWNDVLDNESIAGKNLIPNTMGNEWKSFDENAYNWKTDSFIVYDGSTWVTASREAVAYYMDPRNFLDEDNIFQFELLTYEPSYQTYEGVEGILKNTMLSYASAKYQDDSGQERAMTYGEIFMAAAEYSGVSPLHLASRVKQEVVIGTNSVSNSVTGTVAGFEGLYNFYNIGAYHSTVAGGAIANGLKYAKNGGTNAALNESMLIPWTDPYRSILGGAYYIGYSYISRGQNTIYLQKFNVTPTSTYAHQYMGNVEAPYSEGRKVAAAYKEFSDLPLVFSIPVYLNMPEEACPVPTTAYNPNNWLKSLAVEDEAGNRMALTPTFDITVDQEYYLVVDSSCESIRIVAETVSDKAIVTGDGWNIVEAGNNTFTVGVMAENGDIKEYQIIVARSE